MPLYMIPAFPLTTAPALHYTGTATAADCTKTGNLLDPAVYSHENIARAPKDTMILPRKGHKNLRLDRAGGVLMTAGLALLNFLRDGGFGGLSFTGVERRATTH